MASLHVAPVTLAALALLLATCVLASLAILVRVSDASHPGAVTTISAVVSALITTTALSAVLATLIGGLR